jgi:hypothetical protein
MDALHRVLHGRAAPVAVFEVYANFMGLCGGWFHEVFCKLCGSDGLLELSITNTKYTECYALPSPVYTNAWEIGWRFSRGYSSIFTCSEWIKKIIIYLIG